MTKIFLIIILISAISFSTFAQDSIKGNFTNKHELSLIIDGIFNSNDNELYPYELSPIHEKLYVLPDINVNPTRISVGYKYHFTKFAIRSKLSISIRNQTTEDPVAANDNEVKYLLSKMFIGYEFHKNMNNTQFFYGADLLINYDKIESFEANYDDRDVLYEYNKLGYGISPFIGVKYFVSPMVSFSTEFKVYIEKYEGEYSVTELNNPHNYDFDGSNIKFGPLGSISINIHF